MARIAHPLEGTRLYGVPLMMDRRFIERLIAVNEKRDLTRPEARTLSLRARDQEQIETYGYAVVEGVAVVPVMGAIMKRGTGDDWWDQILGICSVEKLADTFARAHSDPSAHATLLQIDSGGGETCGVFDFADAVYAARGDRPIWAIADEWAFSAAYCIASAADRVFVPRTGGLGSIGVYGVRIDATQMDADIGVTWHILEYGKRKADGHPHKPATTEELEELQAEITRIGVMFRDTVSRNRDLEAKAIDRMQARAFYGGDTCVALGLADGEATFEAVMEELATRPTTAKRVQTGGKKNMTVRNQSGGPAGGDGSNVIELDAHREAVSKSEADGRLKGAEAERERLATIANICVGAGRPDLIGQYQADPNATPATVSQAMAALKVQADRTLAPEISGARPPGASGDGAAASPAIDGDALIAEQRKSAQRFR